MTRLVRGRTIVALATSIAIAPVVSALPASARTLERAPNGSLVQNPASPQFACAMQRALRARDMTCRTIHLPPRRVRTSATPAASGSAQAVSATVNAAPRPEMRPRTPAVAAAMVAPKASAIASDIAAGRRATAKYQHNLTAAKAAGYRIITRMIPDMGYHFMNAHVKGFSVRKPPILVYEHRGHSWQLGAFEWVFTSRPATPPLPGAHYGVFGAACHYVDGTLVYQKVESKCAANSPFTGAAFSFWHPRLITLHLWLWYPNPAGMFSGMNPLVAPFNRG